MKIGLLIFFGVIFILSTVLHLYASFTDNRTLRAKTKWEIVPALGLIYILLSPNVNIPFVLALFFCFLGDVFLIKKSSMFFTLGGIFFLLAHVFFIITYTKYTHFEDVPVWVIFISLIFYGVAVFWGLRKPSRYVKKTRKILFFSYLFVNALNSIFALMWLVSNPGKASVTAFCGATFFIISDMLLFHCRFTPNSIRRKHFYVMLTYILAEILLVMANILAEAHF